MLNRTDSRPGSYGYAMLYAGFSLLLFFLLYTLRSLDDSRLASWQDVFGVAGLLKTGIALVAAFVLAFAAARLDFIGRRPAAVLFVLSFALSACFWQEPEMIVDAARYITQAKHLELYGLRYFFSEWGAGINAWTDLPAVPFFYGLIFRAFGEGRVFVQIFITLLFSCAVVLTYLTGKELWDKETGVNAGLFLLGIPYLYTQVPLMLVDVPSMFFLMLSVYTFLLALRRGGMMVPLSGLSICLAFFTKYSTWLMLTVLPVIFATELYRNRKQGLDRFALRGMIVFFVSFFMISVLLAFHHDVMMRQIHLLLSYQWPGLQRWGESLLSTCLFQLHPAIPLLAVVSMYAAIRKRDHAFIIVVWLVLLMLVLQIRRIRYIIMAFPMLSLMASYGLSIIRDRRLARLVPLSAAAFSFAVAFTAFLPFLQSTSPANVRDAARYLDTLDIQTAHVFTPLPEDHVMNPSVSVPLLDLFTEKAIRYDYHEAEYPPPEDLETSPFRFTWTYRNPAYYQGSEMTAAKKAVVIVTDSTEERIPEPVRREIESYSHRRTFAVSDDAYRHQTLITVYH